MGTCQSPKKFQKKRYAKVKIFLNVEFKQSKTFALGPVAQLVRAVHS